MYKFHFFIINLQYSYITLLESNFSHCIFFSLYNLFLGKTDTPPVECSSRNSFIEPNIQNSDADSITSEYTRDKASSTIDLKVEIHRKNSSESSEEAQQLSKPMITSINVHEAELVSAQYHEPRSKNIINGNSQLYVIIYVIIYEKIKKEK